MSDKTELRLDMLEETTDEEADQIRQAIASDYILKRMRRDVERSKNATGMRVGLPSTTVDAYELERVLNKCDAYKRRIEELDGRLENLLIAPGHGPDCVWWDWDWKFTWSTHDCTCGRG